MIHSRPRPEVGRLARDGPMLSALLGEDRVAGWRRRMASMISASDRWSASVTTSRALLWSIRSSRS